MEHLKDKIGKLEKFKYPLLILLIGVALMLFPSTGSKQAAIAAADENALLQQVLSCTEGVGDARVIVSENGVVVVCHGAEDAKVRLDILKAIGAYTGFGSDKISILKMVD